MKKLCSKFALACVLLNLTYVPMEQAQAGFVIMAGGYLRAVIEVERDNDQNDMAASYAIGGTIIGFSVAMIGGFLEPYTKIGTVILVLDEKDTNQSQIGATLTKNFPEINDLSLIEELAIEIDSEYSKQPSEKGYTLVKLAPELTHNILERSDLSSQQIEHIATILN